MSNIQLTPLDHNHLLSGNLVHNSFIQLTPLDHNNLFSGHLVHSSFIMATPHKCAILEEKDTSKIL